MNALTLNPNKKHFTFIIQNLVSFFTILLMFFTNKQHYSFAWMANPRSWLSVLVYMLFFSVGQMIVKVYIFKKEYGVLRSILSGALGVLISAAIFYLFAYLGHILP